MSKLLVVDDEERIRSMIRKYGEFEGHEIEEAVDGMDAIEKCKQAEYDLIIMDIMMPNLDGFSAVKEIRKDVQTPVIMLSARGEEYDRIHGFEIGVDDYVVKPFVARELLARIKTILRRFRTMPPNLQVTEAGRLVVFGEWQLDTVARHLIDNEGMVVALSGAEYRLLRVFLDHPQRVLTRDQLLNLTQGRDAELFERSIDLLVSRVRQRLNEDARSPAYIKTVRSEGYVFTMPVTIVEANE